jgi:hypothetical protein
MRVMCKGGKVYTSPFDILPALRVRAIEYSAGLFLSHSCLVTQRQNKNEVVEWL